MLKLLTYPYRIKITLYKIGLVCHFFQVNIQTIFVQKDRIYSIPGQ